MAYTEMSWANSLSTFPKAGQMDDLTLTQLFARMDVHLRQQDEHLTRQDVEFRALHETLAQQNAQMLRMSELLATTAKEVAAIHAEASRQHAATMAAFEALIARLEGPRWTP